MESTLQDVAVQLAREAAVEMATHPVSREKVGAVYMASPPHPLERAMSPRAEKENTPQGVPASREQHGSKGKVALEKANTPPGSREWPGSKDKGKSPTSGELSQASKVQPHSTDR